MSNKYDDAESKLNEYEVVKKIGNGRFGEVFLVKHKRTQEFFCWKAISYKGLKDREKSQLVIEVNVMRELKHPNIVKYIDRFLNKANQKLYILMEFCDAGDLSRNIQKCYKMFGKIEEHAILDITRQLLLALSYCHNLKGGPNGERVLHRDLKPQNIFLSTGIKHVGRITPQANNMTNKPIAKIGDFGLSKNIGIESMAHSCVGTPYYWSPELLLHESKSYDDKSDMWALGCIVYELCSGKTPFHRANNFAELVSELKKGPEFPLKGKSKELNNLVRSLLSLSPGNRPSAMQCLGFQIIQSVSSPNGPRRESAEEQVSRDMDRGSHTQPNLYPPEMTSGMHGRGKERQRNVSSASRQDRELVDRGNNGGYAMRLKEKEQLERDRREMDRRERDRLERDRLERDRLERDRLERDRLERDRLERDRLERDRLERDRLEREKSHKKAMNMKLLERERLDVLEKERMKKLERERERERERMEELERERERMEKLERERIEKLERERIEKLERERELERLEQLEKERKRMEKERMYSNHMKRERMGSERVERVERVERDRDRSYYSRDVESVHNRMGSVRPDPRDTTSRTSSINRIKVQSKQTDEYGMPSTSTYDRSMYDTKEDRYARRKSTYQESDEYVDRHVNNPVASRSSINPVTNRSSINPVTNRSSINPVTNRSSINPVTSRNSINPMTSRNSINPGMTRNSIHPIQRHSPRYSNTSSAHVGSNYQNGTEPYSGGTISQYSNNSTETIKHRPSSQYQSNPMKRSSSPKELFRDPTDPSYRCGTYEQKEETQPNQGACKSNRVSNVYYGDHTKRSLSGIPPSSSSSSIHRNRSNVREETSYMSGATRDSRNVQNIKDREYLLEQRRSIMERKNESYGSAKVGNPYDFSLIPKSERYEALKNVERGTERGTERVAMSRKTRCASVSLNPPDRSNRNPYETKGDYTYREAEDYPIRHRTPSEMKQVPRNNKYDGGIYTCR